VEERRIRLEPNARLSAVVRGEMRLNGNALVADATNPPAGQR